MPAKTTKKSTKTTTQTKAKAQTKATTRATVGDKTKATPKATAKAKVKTVPKAKVKAANAPSKKAAPSSKKTAPTSKKTAPTPKRTAAGATQKKTAGTRSLAAAKAKPVSKTAQRKARSEMSAVRPPRGAKSHKISPNTITLIRIILAFVWLAACELFIEPPAILNLTTTRFAEISVAPLILAAVFFVIALTDFIDGYFARKNDSVSNLGIFLDPIADKILVLCGLLFLMQYGYINIWVVVIIAAREFLVSGMRMSVAKKGVVVAASGIGKTKTALTMASVVGFFLYMGMPPLLLASTIVFWISQILLLFAIFFTIWSGLEYFAENKKYLS